MKVSVAGTSLKESEKNVYESLCKASEQQYCGSTHPSMSASEENKLPPSFSAFKSQTFLHESSYDGVSGTDNDERSLKTLATVSFIFGCSKRSSDFKTLVYFL